MWIDESIVCVLMNEGSSAWEAESAEATAGGISTLPNTCLKSSILPIDKRFEIAEVSLTTTFIPFQGTKISLFLNLD